MLAIIGSHAMNQWLPIGRKPGDTDIVGDYQSAVDYCVKNLAKVHEIIPVSDGDKLVAKGWDRDGNQKIIEAEIAWPGSLSEELLHLIVADENSVKGDGIAWASLNICYMLKMTHRYLKNSPHFLKTMGDIKAMREAGCSIQPEHAKFFKRREKATYTYKHPNLKTSKKDFFNGDGVEYVYDHDSIHHAVKHLEKPAYTYFKPDENEVFCDKELFFAQPERVRLLSVLEESYVLSLERSLIPFRETVKPEWAFKTALMKVCTSIASGWWREYAYDNYDKVLNLYDESYVTRFWNAVEAGSVDPAR